MENNNNNQENNNPSIIKLFEEFQAAGGQPLITQFKKYIDQQIDAHVKPLCGRSNLSSGSGSGWRNEQKARFSGRGMKWVKVSIGSIIPTLDKFDYTGQTDTQEYRAWINEAGYAWIRYNGPRIKEGHQAAAFEVRTTGSKFDQPKELHYILDADIDKEITYLHSTPHAMRLEEIKVQGVYPPLAEDVQVAEEVQVDEDIVTEDDEFGAMDMDMDVELD